MKNERLLGEDEEGNGRLRTGASDGKMELDHGRPKFCFIKKMEVRGIEPRASRMRSERSTN